MNRITRNLTQRPGLILLFLGVVVFVAVLVTGILEFEQNILGLLPQNNRAFQLLSHTVTSSNVQEKVYILVKSGELDQKTLLSRTEALIQRLKKIKSGKVPSFGTVTMKRAEAVNSSEFTLLLDDYLADPSLFLNKDDHVKLAAFFLSKEELDTEIRRSLALLATPGSSELAAVIAKDPLNLRRFLIEKLQSMQGSMDFANRPEMMSADGEAIILIATPTPADNPQLHARKLVQECQRIFKDFPDLNIGITGGYVIAAQEEQIMKGDIRACMIGSSIGISLLFLLAYHCFSVLLFIILPLGVGLQLALGVMALCFGQVHIISVAFSAVVLGLGVDFAIHVYDRYGSERFQGKSRETATHYAIFKTGSAVFVGGLTSLTAFIVLTFTGSPVLQQIGWLVSLGLFFSLVSILLALPAWLNWLEKRNPNRQQKAFALLGTRALAKTIRTYPKFLVAFSILLVLLALPGIKNIHFERSLEALHPKGLEALFVRQTILEHFSKGITGVFVSFASDTPEEFWRQSRKIDLDLQQFQNDKRIANFASLTTVTSPLTFQISKQGQENLQTILNRYRLDIGSFPSLEALIEKTNSPPRKQDTASLSPVKLHQRFFMKDNGKYVGITWVNALSEQTVTDMANSWREDDIMVVTLDMALATLMETARSNMYKTVSIAFFLVTCILLVFFRSVPKAMLAMLPTLLGMIVTAGVMGIIGISFNPLNFIILPILIGIGLDDGIHIVDRYRETKDIQKTITTTGRSIMLTSLTTCLGFGSLALAKYHVLANMGMLTIVGVSSCFFFSAVFLPSLLSLGSRHE